MDMSPNHHVAATNRTTSSKSQVVVDRRGTSIDLMIVWQSLVVSTYRSLWRFLDQRPGWRVTMIAPAIFQEGGLQAITCQPNAVENPRLIALRTKSLHIQAVWFTGLVRQTKNWLQKSCRHSIVIIFAEPYSLTALWAYLKIAVATLMIGRKKPKIYFYGFQNIFKNFSLPIKLLQSWMFRCAAGIFVAGQEHEEVLRRHGYDGPCFKWPMWFDQSLFYPPQPTEIAPVVSIGYVGSLSEEKGILFALDALIAAPSERLSNVAIKIVGRGPAQSLVEEKIAQLKARGINADFLGPMAPLALPDFYRSLSILIVPSLTRGRWKEQFGRVIIEGMACGCYVIGSSSGEIPHVIDDPARIFYEDDARSFLEVLDRAINAVAIDRLEVKVQTSQKAYRSYSDQVVATQLGQWLELQN